MGGRILGISELADLNTVLNFADAATATPNLVAAAKGPIQNYQSLRE